MAGSHPPNVVASTLEDARDAVVAAGWMVGEVIETQPPRRTLEGPRRVVRQRVAADGSVELVVCGERAVGARV